MQVRVARYRPEEGVQKLQTVTVCLRGKWYPAAPLIPNLLPAYRPNDSLAYSRCYLAARLRAWI